ncbi:hypothetical protein BS50DRAFT_636864 [Corynespora cassiicola Philippines]|uniref:Uncharacterized protein n=1 Tax=Corynespora cassiicola Philippines TaxID=1448308 RepID=A0A2T2NH25_CORCC|nr:hypothetical protein BS50DRAFT_636864 [Corynespora cassiicola Philippines]
MASNNDIILRYGRSSLPYTNSTYNMGSSTPNISVPTTKTPLPPRYITIGSTVWGELAAIATFFAIAIISYPFSKWIAPKLHQWFLELIPDPTCGSIGLIACIFRRPFTALNSASIDFTGRAAGYGKNSLASLSDALVTIGSTIAGLRKK